MGESEGEGESSGSGWASTPIVQRAQRSRLFFSCGQVYQSAVTIHSERICLSGRSSVAQPGHVSARFRFWFDNTSLELYRTCMRKIYTLYRTTFVGFSYHLMLFARIHTPPGLPGGRSIIAFFSQPTGQTDTVGFLERNVGPGPHLLQHLKRKKREEKGEKKGKRKKRKGNELLWSFLSRFFLCTTIPAQRGFSTVSVSLSAVAIGHFDHLYGSLPLEPLHY